MSQDEINALYKGSIMFTQTASGAALPILMEENNV